MYVLEIHGIFDETPKPPTMGELVKLLDDLIALADHLGLRQPHYTTVCNTGNIGLQLPPDMDSVQAVHTWAKTYAAVARSETRKGRNGPEIRIRTDFSFDDVNVTVYAHIPVPVEGPTETAYDERPF